MKIAHLLGWYFPDSVGGTEVYVQGLCRRLRAAGHEVLIAAPDARGIAATDYEHDGVRVFRYGIAVDPSRDEVYHRVPVRGADALHRWLAQTRPDVLHVHSITTGIGLPEFREAARLGIRVISTCHLPSLGYMCRTGELMQWGMTPCDGIVLPHKCASCNLTRLGMNQTAGRLIGAMPLAVSKAVRRLPGRLGTALGMPASIVEYAGMQRDLFSIVEKFVVLNETARRMLVANGAPAEKIVVNRLGISHVGAARKPGPDDAPTPIPVRFGYLGRFDSTKGVLELVRAVRTISRGVRFDLAIRGPRLDRAAQSYFDAVAREADGDPRVRFLPAVAANDVPGVLSELDALLCPSLWFENGPTIALESMAAGTPVIASAVGNLAEIVEDGVNGRLVPVRNARALASAIEEAALRPAETIDVWRRRLTPPRTMDEIARDYLELYAA